MVVLLCEASSGSLHALTSTERIFILAFSKTKQHWKTNSLCRPNRVRADTNTGLQPLAGKSRGSKYSIKQKDAESAARPENNFLVTAGRLGHCGDCWDHLTKTSDLATGFNLPAAQQAFCRGLEPGLPAPLLPASQIQILAFKGFST